MKWLLFLFIVLTAAFFVADFVAENTAEKRIEERLTASVENAEGLEVDVGGGLFLPQLFGGGFDEIEVAIVSIQRGGLRVDDVSFVLRDVGFSLGDLAGGGGGVTVGGGRGRAFVAQRSLDAALRREGVEADITLDNRATVTARGVTGQVEKISVEGDSIVFAAPPLDALRLDLPDTVASLRYSGARVQGNRLVLSLTVPKGKVDL